MNSLSEKLSYANDYEYNLMSHTDPQAWLLVPHSRTRFELSGEETVQIVLYASINWISGLGLPRRADHPNFACSTGCLQSIFSRGVMLAMIASTSCVSDNALYIWMKKGDLDARELNTQTRKDFYLSQLPLHQAACLHSLFSCFLVENWIQCSRLL